MTGRPPGFSSKPPLTTAYMPPADIKSRAEFFPATHIASVIRVPAGAGFNGEVRMRERMRVIMSVKVVENLRRILLIVLFGALSCYLTIRAVSAISQSERAQPAPQTQRPGETQTKPAPTPSATQPTKKADTPPAEEQNETIKINSKQRLTGLFEHSRRTAPPVLAQLLPCQLEEGRLVSARESSR
jgi:hypothetical protein